MPSRQTNYRRKVWGRSIVGRSGQVALYNQPAPFPNRQYFHNQRYMVDYLFYSGAVGVSGSAKLFQLNSLYAPEYSGGHQPYERDQAAAIYQFYKITHVTVKITWYSAQDSAMVGMVAFLNSSNTTTMTGESYYVSAERIGVYATIVSASGANDQKTVTYNWSIAELDGLTPQQNALDDARYLSLMGGNPAAIPKMEVTAANSAGNEGYGIRAMIEIFYSGYYSGRLQVAQS